MAEPITHDEWLAELDRLFQEQDAKDESANTISSREAAAIWGTSVGVTRRRLGALVDAGVLVRTRAVRFDAWGDKVRIKCYRRVQQKQKRKASK